MAIDSPKNDFAEKHRWLTYADDPDTVYDGSKIIDGSITTEKLADYAVTTDKIDDESITTAKLDDDIITTAKIADGAITLAKLGSSVQEQLNESRTVAIFIGNSYTQGVGSSTGTDGIYVLMKDDFDEAYMFTGGGYGFATYEDHTETFLDLLNNAINSTSFDNEDVTHIFFISAMGDTRAIAQGNQSQLQTNVQTAATTVINNFPNATMYIAYCEMVKGRTTQSYYSNKYYGIQLRVHRNFKEWFQTNRYVYLGWLGWNRNNTNNVNASDNYHPNDAGYNSIVTAFKNALNGVTPYVTRYATIGILNVRMTAPDEGLLIFSNMSRSIFNGSFSASVEIKVADIITSDFLPAIFPIMNDVNHFPVRIDSSHTVMFKICTKQDSSGNMALYVMPYENLTDISTSGTCLHQNIFYFAGSANTEGYLSIM